jgi:phosphoribosyl 1,2-cyclic phosphodiesterase
LTPTDEFSVRFWGVRGSIACPGQGTVKYGGNTPCVEIRCGGRVLMFDAGTGAREMGDLLLAEGVREADLFLSHTHIDHINGFPFFSFAFDPKNRLRVWAGHLQPASTIEAVLRSFMSEPMFPVPVDTLRGCVALKDFQAGEDITVHGTITIRTTMLNHPNGATGYRVEHGGKAICYVTDTEHVPGRPDQNILQLIDGADILIYDAMYTDEEFQQYQGWGHSTWQECLRLCREAGVKVPVIYHHLPGRDDAALDAVAEAADREFPGAIIAREGMTLTP